MWVTVGRKLEIQQRTPIVKHTDGKDIRMEANASGTTGNIDSTIADVLKTNTNVTWADVVKKGLDTSGERKSKLTDALFREVILSKQSSS